MAEEETPRPRGRTTQEMLAERSGPGFLGTVLRTVVGIAIVAVLLVGIYFGARALEGDKPVERAPWAAKNAPDVKPAPLDPQ
jgi:hypothetical protein